MEHDGIPLGYIYIYNYILYIYTQYIYILPKISRSGLQANGRHVRVWNNMQYLFQWVFCMACFPVGLLTQHFFRMTQRIAA